MDLIFKFFFRMERLVLRNSQRWWRQEQIGEKHRDNTRERDIIIWAWNCSKMDHWIQGTKEDD